MTQTVRQQLGRLRRRAQRERRARRAAEHLLDSKARELTGANQRLAELNRTLEDRVTARTRDLEQARRMALDLAEKDQLTGLSNRRSFQRLLQECFIQWADMPQIVLILIDIDNFKHVNDTHGHLVGDMLLREAGRRIAGIAEEFGECLPARLGGDEFAVIVSGENARRDVETLTARIIETLRRPVQADETTLRLTCSLGYARFPAQAKSREDLHTFADIALFEAKARGRNRACGFDEELRSRANERHVLLEGLRKGGLAGEIEVWYQPQTCLRTGEVVGLEALSRWRNKTFGLLTPHRFIQLAEDNGLIGTLTECLIDRVLKDLKDWHGRGLVRQISINISPHDLHERQLSTLIGSYLKMHGLDAGHLEIEITENAMMWNMDRVRTELEYLADLGVRIALDDFGTGYSNLAYLSTLPIHCLKIDRTFVTDIETNPNNRAIVKALISLAHNLRLRTVVEGIETAQQRNLLALLGCDVMQGYFDSVPLNHADCDRFLRTFRPGQWGPACVQGQDAARLSSH